MVIVPLRIFYCCISKPQLPQLDYFEKKAILNSDYDRLNPATKAQAITDFEHYLEELEHRQELPDHSRMIKLTMTNMKRKEILNPRLLASRKDFMEGNRGPQYNLNLDQYRNIAHEIRRSEQNGSGSALM